MLPLKTVGSKVAASVIPFVNPGVGPENVGVTPKL
jgi:hypothetical protein